MLIDISRPLKEDIYVYEGDPKYSKSSVFSIKDGDICNVTELHLGTHTGTHIDAPKHFFDEHQDISSMVLNKFCGKAKVLNFENIKDITMSNLINVNIEEDDIILFKTNAVKFDGVSPIDNYACISECCANYLITKKIKLVGIDYLTIESETSNTFNIHKIFLQNNIPILENINLKFVPEGSYKLYCFPLPLKDCDASPVRAVLETL